MLRRFTSAQAALAAEKDDRKCAKRARAWGMTDSAKHWENNAEQAWGEFLRITEETDTNRRNRGR